MKQTILWIGYAVSAVCLVLAVCLCRDICVLARIDQDLWPLAGMCLGMTLGVGSLVLAMWLELGAYMRGEQGMLRDVLSVFVEFPDGVAWATVGLGGVVGVLYVMACLLPEWGQSHPGGPGIFLYASTAGFCLFAAAACCLFGSQT